MEGERAANHTGGRRRGWTVAAMAAAAVLSACGSQSCTAVGCSSGVSITTPSIIRGHPVSAITVCGLGPCRTVAVTAMPSGMLARVSVPTSSLPPSHRVSVTVEVLDASGADLITASGRIGLSRMTPNGPKCGPVCFFRDVSVGSDGSLSVTSG